MEAKAVEAAAPIPSAAVLRAPVGLEQQQSATPIGPWWQRAPRTPQLERWLMQWKRSAARHLRPALNAQDSPFPWVPQMARWSREPVRRWLAADSEPGLRHWPAATWE